jgi:hypothetical protein
MAIQPRSTGDNLMQSTQPTDWHHIWLCVKSFVEFLYFLAGIGIVIAAWKALDQIRLAKDQLTTTKDIAKATALREAVKLASDQLKFFADVVLPAQTAAVAKYHEHQCTFLAADPVQPGMQPVVPFLINNGDFAQVNYNLAKITPAAWESVKTEFIVFVNALENFAVPFAAGVADDATGFQETAPIFISIMQTFMPVFYYLRQTQGSRWASVLKLFNLWNNRVAANVLAQALPAIKKMIEDAGNNQIPPL